MSWDRGNWMQTYTGRQFFPLDPRPGDIEPLDIAHALGHLCRYNGHVDRFYSVAEHCVLMSHAVPPEDAAWALLHDATEAYVGDMIRPLKLHMPDYRAVEDRVMAAIAERFWLTTKTMPASVRDADNRILLTERAALMTRPPAPWGMEGLPALRVEIHGWSPDRAKDAYVDRLVELELV